MIMIFQSTNTHVLPCLHILTLLEVSKSTAPRGTNITPRTKKVGITLFAVITGCHAGSLCCLKAVSVKIKTNGRSYIEVKITLSILDLRFQSHKKEKIGG